jgi:hypothetical protein
LASVLYYAEKMTAAPGGGNPAISDWQSVDDARQEKYRAQARYLMMHLSIKPRAFRPL